MEFKAKSFDELTGREVYEILRSRCGIFMLEQNIICQDMDRVDFVSRHLFLEENGEVVAYLRAFYSEQHPELVYIGRVLSLRHGEGLGLKLMQKSLAYIKENMSCNAIRLHSQTQAVGFYEKFGFYGVSEEFMEEGVPHIEMELDL